MKKFKVVVLSLVLVLSLGVFVGCSGSPEEDSTEEASTEETSTLETIKENDKLRIGVFGDKPPFGYVDEQGEYQGYDVAVGRRLAKDLLGDESKAEFVLVEAANRVEYLESNKVDIILANFTETEERAEVVDFANPYMKVFLGVVSSEDELITDVEQLKGEKLIVTKGTTAEIYFTENYPEIELVKFDQHSEAYNALKDGRGAAVACDNTIVLAWANENPSYTVGITALGEQAVIAPAVKKGDTKLLNWINEDLEKLGEENFMHKAYEDTLQPAYGDAIDPDDVVVEGGKIEE